MKQAKSYLIFTVLFLFLVGLFSCEKERKIDIPVVDLHNPYENQHYTVGDTILIFALVESVSKIESVDIAIVDENLKPITKNYIYSKLNDHYRGEIYFAIILEDVFMQAGRYQVMVKVRNKEETKHKYRWIYITSPDKELLGAAVVTKATNRVNVWNYDTNFHKTIRKVMIGDYSGSAYLPFHNRMALSAKVQGSYTIWDYPTGDTVLSFQAMANPPFPYFTGVAIVDDLFTVQYYSGTFGLYNYMGMSVNVVNASAGYYIDKVFDVGNNYISFERQKSSTTMMRLVTHIGSTGKNVSFHPVPGPIVAAFPLDGDDFLFFSNYTGTGQIEKYYWSNNGSNHPIYFPSGEFVDVAMFETNEYLLLTQDKVWRYRYHTGSITPLFSFSGVDPIKIRYNMLSKRIWVVDKQGFAIYSQFGQLISDHRVNEEVLNLHLIYNL